MTYGTSYLDSSGIATFPSCSNPETPVNPGRSPYISFQGHRFLRVPIKTHVLSEQDDIVRVVDDATRSTRQPGDVIFVSEKAVAVTQGRALNVESIKIGLTARLLWRMVRKVPFGIGLRSPETMQCAVNECGAPRIWIAAMVGALGKSVGRRGDFYRVAGTQAATIDAANTSPLYPHRVILGPKNPERVAAAIRGATGHEAAIVDVNDIGGSQVLGGTGGVGFSMIEACLKDNPLGQKDEQTPIGLLRRVIK